MAELTTLSRPYAEAIAALAREGNTWQSWSDALAILGQLAQDSDMADLIANPAVSAERVIGVMRDIGGAVVTSEASNLLMLLAENKRLILLPVVSALFEEARAAAAGVLEAEVTTAYPLDAVQMEALRLRLETKFGRKIEARQKTDAALIGGVIIAVGDEVMDASVRGRLEKLAVAMAD